MQFTRREALRFAIEAGSGDSCVPVAREIFDFLNEKDADPVTQIRDLLDKVQPPKASD